MNIKNTKNQQRHKAQLERDTTTANELLARSFESVMQRIPEHQRQKLQNYWSTHQFLNPQRQPYHAPTFGVCPGFMRVSKKAGDGMPYRSFDGGFFLFDLDYVTRAPKGVLDETLAWELAKALIMATGEWRDDAELMEEKRRFHVFSWGFLDDQFVMWAAAMMASPKEPEVTFYAFRYARRLLPPPLTADLAAIARKLGKNGCPELAKEILRMANRQASPDNPKNPDQPPAPSAETSE